MSRHQKRLSAPKDYPIERKDNTYVITGQGPHAADTGLPLLVVLRDVLAYVDSMTEAQQVLDDGKVLVDGINRTNPAYTVGFMDIISFPDMDEAYRVLLDSRGFILQQVEDADVKLARVEDKTTLSGGVTQLNLHDGNNIEVDDAAAYDTRSSLVLSLPDKDIDTELAFTEGNRAYISGGRHAGVQATITDITERPGGNPRTVTLKTDDDTELTTVEDNVYVIGEDSAEVDVDVE
jgi:small subunit ribosomal protein S4e